MSAYDALVIGAGHNGLVTAVRLAQSGLKTLVLERNDAIGGAIRSAELTKPGFVHDAYSMNMNLFLASPAWAAWEKDLTRHGLRFSVSDHPYCNVFPDGTSLRVYRDAERTLDGIRRHDARDAEGWTALYERFEAFQKTLLPLYHLPLPSAAAAAHLGKVTVGKGTDTLLDLAKIVLASTRELGEAYFASPEMRALIATWGLHLDYGPDVSAGGMFPFLEAFSDMQEGMAVVTGGASRLPEALAAMLEENGGEIRTGSEVVRVLHEDGRATGAELASGERIAAHRVVANLAPTVLFDRLLPDAPLPVRFRAGVARYAHGPATMMVHLALDGPAPWRGGDELARFAYVHIAPYVEDLARAYTDAMNGLLPADPLLIVGQTTAVDPSRTPDDHELLWIQVRPLPSTIRGDAAGEIDAADWDAAADAYAERVVDKLERYAPGVRERIVGRHVMSPRDLERGNPNLVGGDSIGGSHHVFQNFVWRPLPGWSRYRMPLEGLFMVGAGTWPGGGNNATSGWLAADEIVSGGPARTIAGTLAGLGAAAGAAGALFKLFGGRSDG